jgi:hypothetical protein
MSEIVSASTFVAEQLQISVTPVLERKWRIFEILDDVESGYEAKFYQFIFMR